MVHEAREPATGAVVVFRRTGGAELLQDSVVAISGPEGRFHLEAEAAEGGEVVGSITVRSDVGPEYTIDDVHIPIADIRGDGSVLPQRWVVDPYFDFLGELYAFTTQRPIGVYSKVTFRRTGGIEIEPDTFVAETDFDGRFTLTPKALGHGEIVGDLTVRGVIGDRFDTRVIRDVRFSTTHVERPLAVRGVWYLGLSMRYVGQIHYRTDGEPAVGVPVHFERTGGLEVEPDTFTVRTDGAGRFPLRFEPEESGVLTGRLTFELGPPVGTVTYDVEIPSLDVVEERVFNVWTLGPGLNYVGEVRGMSSGDAITGVPIRLVRKGGIAVREEVYAASTDELGRFEMKPFPLEAGEYVAELIVDLPAPQEDFTTEVRLQTFETDELRLAGVWYVPGL